MPKTDFPKNVSTGDKYGPAMTLTTQEEADAYFEACVAHQMTFWKKPRDEAEQTERENLGYYAGYYDRDTRARVERLFKTKHPFLGTVAETEKLSPDEIFAKGYAMGRQLREETGAQDDDLPLSERSSRRRSLDQDEIDEAGAK